MAKKVALEIAAGIGDSLVVRIFFDAVKHEYDQIIISHSKSIVNQWRNGDPNYFRFLYDWGTLLFSENPFVYSDHARYIDVAKTLMGLGTKPKTPNLHHLLCKGNSLNLGEEYIVLTTKIRCFNKKLFYPLSIKLWGTLKKLSQKYKIVILGEKLVEMRKEYNSISDSVFGLYEQIISNIPNNRILDLTVPALGETVSDLVAIRQDCLIMKEAEFVITLGVGGNFCMATSVANMTIGFRADNLEFTDAIYNKDYHNAIITKNWNYFIQSLEKYS